MRIMMGLALAALLVAALPGMAHRAETTSPEPGFRPESPAESEFLADLGTATIAVYPTIVRREKRTAHSFASQEEVIAFLNRAGIGRAVATRRRIDRGRMLPDSQWNIFQSGIAAVAYELADHPVEADYVLALEILVPDEQAVFGIECYILNPAGESAFSFLLNEHQQMFAEAGLVAGDSQAARNAMIDKATRVAMQALELQITKAQACAEGEAGTTSLRPASDVVDDFEAGVPGSSDQHGNALGFSTFRGGEDTSVRIATTTEHPPIPGQPEDNSVLQLDIDTQSWAGVLHRFADDTGSQWVAYDWTGPIEVSFWLYGRDTGAKLNFDILDNRHACSVTDDAERYRFEFTDNFSGWRLISIPLEVMVRADIFNGAPNDGPGLESVHGWGLGALRAGVPVTYYLDDVRLRREPLMENVPEGLSRETDVWVPVNELPMFGGYEPTEWQERANEEFFRMVLPEFDGARDTAAEHFARTGWNLYYGGDWTVAVKRFNQAWLLDRDNQHALWGFAVIERERGQRDEALRYYRMALEAGTGPEYAKLKSEYESLLGGPTN